MNLACSECYIVLGLAAAPAAAAIKYGIVKLQTLWQITSEPESEPRTDHR